MRSLAKYVPDTHRIAQVWPCFQEGRSSLQGILTCLRPSSPWKSVTYGRKIVARAVESAKLGQGSINKHGNPRLRRLLVETVWLLKQWNPEYIGFDRWREATSAAGKLPAARLKKFVVATARQFAVHWWQVRTARVQPEQLGLIMKPAN